MNHTFNTCTPHLGYGKLGSPSAWPFLLIDYLPYITYNYKAYERSGAGIYTELYSAAGPMAPRHFNLLLSLVAGVAATQEENLSRAPPDAPRLAKAKDSAFSSRDASPPPPPPPPKPRGSLPITQAVWVNSIRPRKSPTGSNPASVDPHRTGAWETAEMSEGRFPHKAEGAPQLALAHEAASSSPSKRELEALEREAADLDAFKRKLTSAQVQDHTSGWYVASPSHVPQICPLEGGGGYMIGDGESACGVWTPAVPTDHGTRAAGAAPLKRLTRAKRRTVADI